MSTAKRIAIVVHAGLPGWQALNVTAFLASGIAADGNEVLGEPYRDGSGHAYCRLFNQPVMVFQASPQQLSRLAVVASQSDLVASVFSSGMLKTSNDMDNRATIANVHTPELDLLGIGLLGPRSQIAKLLDGVPKHE